MKTMNDPRKNMNATLKTQYVASKNGQLTSKLKTGKRGFYKKFLGLG
jgi:hypothetical protein